MATPWLHPGTDLGRTMAASLAPHRRSGDLAMVSEKAVVITTGRAVSALGVVHSALARQLARKVRPVGDSKGLSIPTKMQYVVDSVGRPRILLAVAVAAATRPLGVKGGFYVVAGRQARFIDGMRPPFDDLLMPPLAPAVVHRVATDLAVHIGVPVAIVDINDRGGSVRAVSGGSLGPRLLRRILADNPLGHSDQRTPFGLVRSAEGAQRRRTSLRSRRAASSASGVANTRRPAT